MRNRPIRLLAGLALSALALAGCGSSSSGPSASTDLSGSYTLASISMSGFRLTPPQAAGSLVLTSTNYTLNVIVTVPGTPADTLRDAGTYTARSDGSWTQTSTVNNAQSNGTFSLSGSTLTVNNTIQSQQVSSVWQKQ